MKVWGQLACPKKKKKKKSCELNIYTVPAKKIAPATKF
jgi:hypothetical protein